MPTPSRQDQTQWIDENIPLSTRFDDTYYTKSDGRAETDHVYIKGNNLVQRWPEMSQCTIAELGFGTGLNFLETMTQWQQHAKPDASLHFISFEQFPLSKSDIAHALSRWPQLAELSQQLCTLWKPDAPVFETEFAKNVKLTVHLGDANTILPNLELRAHAWYLDGFSPSKNPGLWNLPLMQAVYAATCEHGTFATYSVAGFVRRNLQQAGFCLSRLEGFGSKREMLSGIKNKPGD